MSEEQKDQSSHRASRAQYIENKADLGDAKLTIEETEDGNIVVIRGKWRGHEVVAKSFGFKSNRPTYLVQIDGAEELTGAVAEKNFESYYQIAKIENI